MKYILGLDLGISSVGWGVLNLDRLRIEALGVRAFSPPEDPKTGEMLSAARRTARGARRRTRRRAVRMREIRALLADYKLIDSKLPDIFKFVNTQTSPWQLRAEGLDRKLTGLEFATALYHIAKHRGFKSNRIGEESDKESSKVLSAIKQNANVAQTAYRTPGEMIYCESLKPDSLFAKRKRNTDNDYTRSIGRDQNVLEVKLLFVAQRELGNEFASFDFETGFIELFTRQLPFSNYELIKSKVGKCTFIPTELRAPTNSYTAEYFRLLSDINKLTWYEGGSKQTCTLDQRRLLIERAHASEKITYAQVRKFLKLPNDARFTAFRYSTAIGTEIKAGHKCETAKFCDMRGFREISKILGSGKPEFDLFDQVADILTCCKSKTEVAKMLGDLGLNADSIERAENSAGFSKFGHLSIAAMRKMIPYLESGLVYSDAAREAGFDHSDQTKGIEKKLLLPLIDIEATNNRTVLRTLTQARKVVNAIIRKYGSPYQVNIELARDMGKNKQDRDQITKDIDKKRQANLSRDGELQERWGLKRVTYDARLKDRLYREQDGKCAYSQEPLDYNRLFDDGYAEIDHILPYSRSFDDSMSNKVLVKSAENQNKRNRTPFEYFGENPERWARFETFVETLSDFRKREKLLRKDYSGTERDEWLPRNLVDTQYITREFASFLRTHLLFSDPENKLPVVCVNGAVTSMMRANWGLNKDRDKDDLHHAADACVIAQINPRTIQMITRYRQDRETQPGRRHDVYVDPETGEITDRKYSFPLPWDDFRDELLARLSDDPMDEIAKLNLSSYSEYEFDQLKPVLVSRMPNRKMSGAIHKETIRAVRFDENNKRISVVRVALQSLTASQLENLYATETNEQVYNAIRERLADPEFKGDPKKAFEQPLYKPTKDGMPGPIVRKVKVYETQPGGVDVRGGVADNDSMVRVDVFTKDNKYYLVPIYMADVVAGVLPNRAIVAHKPESEWDVMDDKFQFLFSLYPFDLVQITLKANPVLGYYRSTHRGTAAVLVSSCNNSKTDTSFGTKLAKSFRKFEISILGEISEVKSEKRLPLRLEKRHGLENSRNYESGEVED